MKKLLLFFIALFIIILNPSRASAAAVSWDGGAATANWSDANNWSANALPTADDDVTINQNVTVNIAATTTINSLTVGQNGGGTTPILNFNYDAIANGALILDAGDLNVYTGASITHVNSSSSIIATIFINVISGNGTIVGSIDAAGQGYIAGYGAGTGTGTDRGGGGGHGGVGGAGPVGAGGGSYGSTTAPVTLGSGGAWAGQGGSGGGAIKFNIFGNLTVSGSINANGDNGSWENKAGGAGGSIYLTAGTIAGSGSISANGGTGDVSYVGGGSGGRIALYYTSLTHSGSLTSYGASGYRSGGAGTIYKKPSGQANGDLIINNNNLPMSDFPLSGYTPLGVLVLNNLTIKNNAQAEIVSTTNVSYSSLDWSTNGVIVDDSVSGIMVPFSGGGTVNIPLGSKLYANIPRTYSGLTIGGILTHSNNTATQQYAIDLTVLGDTTLSSSGSINVNYKGFAGGYGDGVGTGIGRIDRAGGGGYGGRGGDGPNGSGGAVYGSIYEPTRIGSGGAWAWNGGSGGGAIKFNIFGNLTVSGSINANGDNGSWENKAGGAGGSIYLIAHSITGSGQLSVVGGNGHPSYTGGGGGGRVAIYYSGDYSYSGTVNLAGGTGYNAGSQGTKVIKASGGELVSTPFNTSDPATLVYDLHWTENLPAGTDVKLQLATAPDNGSGSPGTWSDWLGPSGAGTYFTDPTGGEDIHSTQRDGSNDQWYKYKIIFSAATNDANIPTVSDVTITYVVNTPPTVAITNTPTLSAIGTINVTYTISDPEEAIVTSYLAADIGQTTNSDYVIDSVANLGVSSATSLPSLGTILLDNEMISYSGKSGNSLTGITRAANGTTATAHVAGSVVWFVAPSPSLSGDFGSISKIGTKSVTWTPSSDISILETTTAKIKILVNDGNIANQIGSDSKSSITLDTKAPINNDIYINKRLGQITLSSTDGNALYYKASNNIDLSSDGVNVDSGNWTAYSTPITWTFSGDPSTVYVRYKDAYGNESSTISTQSPTRLSSLLIQDGSNPDTHEWRLFTSWVVATVPVNGFSYYQLYRSTDGATYTPLTQIGTRAQNYYLDQGLDSAITYYYKITIVDSHGNESDVNSPIQNSGSSSRSGVGLTPDGSGGGDFTAPNVTNIVVSNITTTTATFTWTTDELSDSTIGYSTNTSYSNEVGSISMGTSHSIVLSNLVPNTSYYYRVISADALNNKSIIEDSSTQSFSTLADTSGPVISDIKAVVGETQAGISWSTTEESNSRVEYSLDSSYGSATTSASFVFGHALTISDLTVDTTYNYHVISVDSNNNSSTSPNYSFTTSAITLISTDTTAPSISDISVSSVTPSSAKISWSTNEDADGKVEYGESSSYERGIAEGNHDYKTSKSVTVIGLSPETTYHYRVTVVDKAGNTNSSGDATFSTTVQSSVDLLGVTGSSSGSNAPAITSSGATITDITATSVVVGWDTTKKSTSEVFYKVKNSLDSPSNSGSTSFLSSHSVILSNLTAATSYEYQVKSVDVNGNYVISAKAEFTTSLPGITGIKITNKNANIASISWITAIPTTTVIEYINTSTRETRKYSNSSLVSVHSADLENLYPGTMYSFNVLISDEAGNLARSDQYSFSTGDDTEGPVITGVNNRSTIISGQNKVQTVITWTTNEPTSSLVQYSLGAGSGNYEQSSVENDDFVQNHIVVISGLKPGSVYRYRVVSKDYASNQSESEAYVLLTPQKEVSALDLIIQNLQSSFGWMNKP
jgi:hypothetical protein